MRPVSIQAIDSSRIPSSIPLYWKCLGHGTLFFYRFGVWPWACISSSDAKRESLGAFILRVSYGKALGTIRIKHDKFYQILRFIIGSYSWNTGTLENLRFQLTWQHVMCLPSPKFGTISASLHTSCRWIWLTKLHMIHQQQRGVP